MSTLVNTKYKGEHHDHASRYLKAHQHDEAVDQVSQQVHEVKTKIHAENKRHAAKLAAENKKHAAKLAALEKQLSRLKELTDGDEEEDGARMFPKRSVRWSAASIFSAATIGCICICCQASCCVWCTYRSILEISGSMITGILYAPLFDTNDEDIVEVVRREMRLMMLMPLIPLLAFSETTCESGSPNWVYYIYVPLLLRSKLVEYRLLKRMGRTDLLFSLGFVLGTLENLDYFTDGVFPVQALKCEPEATQLFALSFSQSKVAFLTPLVTTIHFWGAAYVVLSAAVLAQQAHGNGFMPDDMAGIAAADIPGFGGVAKAFEDQGQFEPGASMTRFGIAVVKVLLENCSQLWLQATFLGLIFDRVDDHSKVKLLFSLSLGLLSATYKALGILLASFFSGHDLWFRALWLVFSIIIFCMVAWTVMKLYYTWTCAHHLWNLTSGCVSMQQ